MIKKGGAVLAKIIITSHRKFTMSAIKKKEFTRLSKQVLPYHYDITLSPNLTTFVFTGTENVHLDIKEKTNKIILNAHQLNIKSASYVNEDKKTIPAKKIELFPENETVTFDFAEVLPEGKGGRLILDFVGEINDKMVGLYRTKYLGKNGETKYAAATQFEPISARRCFPCWDEPSHKSTFDITVNVVPGFTVISNMPIISRIPTADLETIKFDRTPIMSTYLVALVIGEFDHVQDKTSNNVLITVYTPPNAGEQGKFALEVTKRTLPYYESYFGIPYPLPKLDLAAIADFSSGAMENWGLITCRENALLVDPKNTSAMTKQWVALVVAHEIAHQWFGNLVTMDWWTHLWLNEGYAMFAEFLSVDHLFPEWDIWTQFVTETHITALELDALKTSHPIEVPIGHPSEIDEIFDDISYNKGASVIRMLHNYIGDKDFRKGMNLYLTRRSYTNAETEDLWDALEEASEKPVRKVMSSWTKQQGFPVVEIHEKQIGNKRILNLSQKRFVADGSVVDGDNLLWNIPVAVITSKDCKKTISNTIMDGKSMELVIDDLKNDDWIKINPGTIGFYRTKYDNDMLVKLIPAIRDRTLVSLDRLGLFNDLFAMVQAGHSTTVDLLKFVQAYKKEDNYTVWRSIAGALGKIRMLLSGSDLEEPLKEFGRELFSEISEKLGWDPKPNEGHVDALFRSLVLVKMVSYNDEKVIKEAHDRFEKHLNGSEILSADIKSPVYAAVLSTGSVEIFETMIKLYCKSESVEEKDRIMNAFSSIKDEGLLKRALEFVVSENVRNQETIYGILSVGSGYQGRILAWEFIKTNWDNLIGRLDHGYLLNRLVKCSIEKFTTKEYAKDVEEFFSKVSNTGIERSIQQGLETIGLNVAWLERDRENVRKFLSQ